YPWGIYVARYSRNVGGWVIIHEHGMTMAGTDIILSALTAISSGSSGMLLTHARLGVTLFFLTIINVILGIIAEKYRARAYYRVIYIFVKIHQILGWGTWVVGIANCILGLDQISMILGDYSVIAIDLKWAFIALIGATAIFMFLFGEYPARFRRNATIAGYTATAAKGNEDEIENFNNLKARRESRKEPKKFLVEFTWEQFQSRIESGKKWLIVDGTIHDVSAYIENKGHPGGSKVIESAIGTDATRIFYGIKKKTDEQDFSTELRLIYLPTKSVLHFHSRFAHFTLSQMAVAVLIDSDLIPTSQNESLQKRFPHISSLVSGFFLNYNAGISPRKFSTCFLESKKLIVHEFAKDP
ncbi:hypothetical protein HK096_009260, partial [Nowakowskiella sp. JEL0078]